MKITDILNLLTNTKSIVIVTPSLYENKLLYDRIKLQVKENIQLIDNNTIQINDSIIKLVTQDNVYPYNRCNTIIVEFPQSIPRRILNDLHAINLIFSNVEIT
jgi:2-C-methyl-D-erythritol 4-phosphate cytidylyltransferase